MQESPKRFEGPGRFEGPSRFERFSGFDKYLRFEDLPLFMSPKQYAGVTGEHVNTVRDKLRRGKIPGDKKGGTWVICRDAAFPNAAKELSGNGD